MSIECRYEVADLVARGSYSKIYLCYPTRESLCRTKLPILSHTNVECRQKYAMKINHCSATHRRCCGMPASIVREIQWFSARASPFLLHPLQGEFMQIERKIKDFTVQMVMDLAECDLDSWLHRHRNGKQRSLCSIPYTLDGLFSIVNQVVRALHALHAADLIHGDIKAANYLIMKGERVLLTDWSFTRRAYVRPNERIPAALLDFHGISWLSKETFAPELLPCDDYGQCRRNSQGIGDGRTCGHKYALKTQVNVSQASDIWSLGVMLLQLFTGHYPAQLVTPTQPYLCMQHYVDLHKMPKSTLFGPPRMSWNMTPPPPTEYDVLKVSHYSSKSMSAMHQHSSIRSEQHKALANTSIANTFRTNINDDSKVTTPTYAHLRMMWCRMPFTTRPHWKDVKKTISQMVRLLHACFTPNPSSRPTAVQVLYHRALTGRTVAHGTGRSHTSHASIQLHRGPYLDSSTVSTGHSAKDANSDPNPTLVVSTNNSEHFSCHEWQRQVRSKLRLGHCDPLILPLYSQPYMNCDDSTLFTARQTSPVMVHWWSKQRPRCVLWAWNQLKCMGTRGPPVLWLLFADALDRLVLGGHSDVQRLIAGYDDIAQTPGDLSEPICCTDTVGIPGTMHSSLPVKTDVARHILTPVKSVHHMNTALPATAVTPKVTLSLVDSLPMSENVHINIVPATNELLNVSTLCMDDMYVDSIGCHRITLSTAKCKLPKDCLTEPNMDQPDTTSARNDVVFVPADDILLHWMAALLHLLMVCETDDHSETQCFLPSSKEHDNTHLQMLIMLGLGGCLQRTHFNVRLFNDFKGTCIAGASKQACRLVGLCCRQPSMLHVPTMDQIRNCALSYAL
jgi:serine/threonine protein kinase